MIIYENVIKNKGSLVNEFGDGMFILFGDNAPDMLKDYCYSIDVKPVKEKIEVGQYLNISGEKFKIIGVGDIAENNLVSLGHITVNFTDDLSTLLPGTIIVEGEKSPKLEIGTIIFIEK